MWLMTRQVSKNPNFPDSCQSHLSWDPNTGDSHFIILLPRTWCERNSSQYQYFKIQSYCHYELEGLFVFLVFLWSTLYLYYKYSLFSNEDCRYSIQILSSESRWGTDKLCLVITACWLWGWMGGGWLQLHYLPFCTVIATLLTAAKL